MDNTCESAIPGDKAAVAGSFETSQEFSWVTASQRGDGAAFNRLVLKWEKSIYNLTLRMLRDPEEAIEACQEVFLAAYRNIRRFRQDSRFSTWLYRIAVNQCITRLRRRPPGAFLSLDDGRPGSRLKDNIPADHTQESSLLREERRTRVKDALEHLNPEQRAVVELKFFQDLTFEQIADTIQAPISTIKSRLYSGLEVLKVRLGHYPLQD